MSTVDLQLLNLKPDATEERLKEFLQQQASVTEILNIEILTPGDNKPRVGVARVIANRAALKADLTGAHLDGNPLDVVFLDEETSPNPQQKGKIDFNQVIEKVKKIYAELNSDELKPIYSEVAAMMIKNGKVDLSSQNLQSVGQKMAPVFGKLSGMFKK